MVNETEIYEEQLQQAAEKIRQRITLPFIFGGGPQRNSVLKLRTFDEGNVRAVIINDDGMLIYARDGSIRLWKRPESVLNPSRIMPKPAMSELRFGYERYRIDV